MIVTDLEVLIASALQTQRYRRLPESFSVSHLKWAPLNSVRQPGSQQPSDSRDHSPRPIPNGDCKKTPSSRKQLGSQSSMLSISPRSARPDDTFLARSIDISACLLNPYSHRPMISTRKLDVPRMIQLDAGSDIAMINLNDYDQPGQHDFSGPAFNDASAGNHVFAIQGSFVAHVSIGDLTHQLRLNVADTKFKDALPHLVSDDRSPKRICERKDLLSDASASDIFFNHVNSWPVTSDDFNVDLDTNSCFNVEGEGTRMSRVRDSNGSTLPHASLFYHQTSHPVVSMSAHHPPMIIASQPASDVDLDVLLPHPPSTYEPMIPSCLLISLLFNRMLLPLLVG